MTDAVRVRSSDPGFAMVWDWLIDEPEINGEALRVYLVFARYANWDDGRTHVKITTIAARLGKSADTITRAVRALEKVGAITVDRRPNKDGKPSEYVVATTARLTANVRPDPPADVPTPSPQMCDEPPRKSAGASSPRTLEQEPPNEIDAHSSINNEPTADEWFDRFWTKYPRKVGKPKAATAFKAAMKRHGVEAIRAGLARQIVQWREAGTGKEFMPHPTTWLNQDRFMDDPEDTTPTPTPTKRVGGRGNFLDPDVARLTIEKAEAKIAAQNHQLTEGQ